MPTYDDPLAFLEANASSSASDAGRLPATTAANTPSIHTGPGAALDMLAQLGRDGARPAGVEPVARPVSGHAVDVLAGLTPLPLPAGAPDRDIEAWARTAPAPREEE